MVLQSTGFFIEAILIDLHELFNNYSCSLEKNIKWNLGDTSKKAKWKLINRRDSKYLLVCEIL
jgi:hypothetical protein